MTKEDKELLLKDLCARLPYGVKLLCANREVVTLVNPPITIQDDCWNFKPYLRPMSSMTEEADEEMEHVIELELQALASGGGHDTVHAAPAAFEIDFYNKHHFDYRGLIENGLALEAPNDMYK